MGSNVSVIISTKNEEKNIRTILKSLREQTMPPHEIIVVDNNSTDRTTEIAAEYTDLIYTKGPERSAQRNFGIGKASCPYVLYLDADMIVTSRVIEELVLKSKQQPDLVGLYIPEVVTGEGFWIKVRSFERGFYNATPVDAVRFFPRKLFLEIGGFDEKLNGSEDWDIDKRLRALGKVGIIKAPLLHNEDGFSLSHYLNKKDYYQPTWKPYIEKWGPNDPDIKKQLGFFYRYFIVFLENGKFLRLLRHPILAFGMYFLRFMVGISFLKYKLNHSRIDSVI